LNKKGFPQQLPPPLNGGVPSYYPESMQGGHDTTLYGFAVANYASSYPTQATPPQPPQPLFPPYPYSSMMNQPNYNNSYSYPHQQQPPPPFYQPMIGAPSSNFYSGPSVDFRMVKY
jgi:hypothetical protein